MIKTKQDFLNAIRDLYVFGNASDSSDDPRKAAWQHANMAYTVCHNLDLILREQVKNGTFTADEIQEFYDNM